MIQTISNNLRAVVSNLRTFNSAGHCFTIVKLEINLSTLFVLTFINFEAMLNICYSVETIYFKDNKVLVKACQIYENGKARRQCVRMQGHLENHEP